MTAVGSIALQGLDSRVRLSSIDAPETAQTCENTKGTLCPCGIMASDELRTLIGNSVVSCCLDGAGGFGRACDVLIPRRRA